MVVAALRFLILLPLAATLMVATCLAGVALAASLMLTAEPYKQALVEIGLYTRLPAVAGAQLELQVRQAGLEQGTEPAVPGAAVLVRAMDAGAWRDLLTAVLPAQWVRVQAESALDQVFADPPRSDIRISMAELKRHLGSGAAAAAYARAAQALPLCTAEDVFAALGALSGLGCRPSAEMLAAAGVRPEALLAQNIDEIPAEVVMPWSGTVAPASGSVPEITLPAVRTALRTVTLVPLAIALVMLVVAWSLRSAARWTAVPTLLAALVLIGLASFGRTLIPAIDGPLVKSLPDYVHPEVGALAVDTARILAGKVLDSLRFVAVLIAALSIGLLVIASRRRASPPPSRPS